MATHLRTDVADLDELRMPELLIDELIHNHAAAKKWGFLKGSSERPWLYLLDRDARVLFNIRAPGSGQLGNRCQRCCRGRRGRLLRCRKVETGWHNSRIEPCTFTARWGLLSAVVSFGG